MKARIRALCRNDAHALSKQRHGRVRLLEGIGVEGDSHAGRTVQHRSRAAIDPTTPNLRQVHLIAAELHDELNAAGYEVSPGAMGENVLTEGIDLLGLPTGTRLHLGEAAALEVTGLRNPCAQLEALGQGMTGAVLSRDSEGGLVRRAGIMAVVITGGEIREGDPIRVELPPEPHRPLETV